MSGSKTRVRRVYAATRDLLDTIRPGTGEEWVGRFRRRFIAPASLFESGAHVLQNMDMPRADALLLSLIPGITRYMQLERFGRSPRRIQSRLLLLCAKLQRPADKSAACCALKSFRQNHIQLT